MKYLLIIGLLLLAGCTSTPEFCSLNSTQLMIQDLRVVNSSFCELLCEELTVQCVWDCATSVRDIQDLVEDTCEVEI